MSKYLQLFNVIQIYNNIFTLSRLYEALVLFVILHTKKYVDSRGKMLITVLARNFLKSGMGELIFRKKIFFTCKLPCM